LIGGYIPFTLRGFGGGVTALVATQASSLLVEAFVARRLGAAGLGTFAVGLSIVTLFTATIVAGCTSAVIRGVADADHRGEVAVVRGHLILGLTSALVASIMTMIVALALAPELSRLLVGNENVADVLRIFALTLPASAVTGVGLAATRALQRISYDVAARAMDASIRLLAVPALIFMSIGVREVALIHLVAGLVALPVAIVPLARRSVLLNVHVAPRYELSEFFSLAGWQVLAAGAWAAARRADVLLVAAMLGARAAGVYRLAILIAAVGGVILAGLQPMFTPAGARRYASSPAAALDHYRRVTRFSALASAPAFALCIAFPDRLLALFGPVFEGGATALVILAVGYAVDSLAGPTTMFLLVVGGAHRAAGNMVVALVLEIALVTALIPTLGVAGAALATAATFMFINAAQLASIAYLFRDLVLDNAWLRCLTAVAALGLASASIRALAIESLIVSASAFAVVLALYAIIVVAVALPSEDRALLRGLVPRSPDVSA